MGFFERMSTGFKVQQLACRLMGTDQWIGSLGCALRAGLGHAPHHLQPGFCGSKLPKISKNDPLKWMAEEPLTTKTGWFTVPMFGVWLVSWAFGFSDADLLASFPGIPRQGAVGSRCRRRGCQSTRCSSTNAPGRLPGPRSSPESSTLE